MRKSGLFHLILCSAFYKAEISQRVSSPFLVASEERRAKEHVTSLRLPRPYGGLAREIGGHQFSLSGQTFASMSAKGPWYIKRNKIKSI